MATDLTVRLRRWVAGATVALALGVAAVVAAPAPPAAAQVTGDVQFTGHGWGHGRGMGQWGARGYAVDHGWDFRRILSHYYGGTTQGTQPDGPITVELSGQAGKDLVVTSGRDFTVGGVRVSAGSAARVQARPDGGYLLSTSLGCTEPVVWTTPITSPRVVPSAEPGADLRAMLSLCTATGTTQYRGELSVVWTAGGQRTVNTLRMEDYLRGVVPRESPASWGDAGGGRGLEALKAQAVAARSYAWAEGRSAFARTCDTTSCQVYLGAGRNHTPLEDRRTDAAIAGTAGVVLRNGNGGIVRAEFSSSTGGWSAGGVFPAVPDEGDATSPYHNWSTSVPAATIAQAFDVGTLTGIRVTGRNGMGADGGRVTTVEVSGTARTVTVSGGVMRTRLELRSDWFVIGGAPPAAPAPVANPVGPAVFMGVPGGTGTSGAVAFGDPGDVPLVGDWNGDGVDTVGVFRSGTFLLGNGMSGRADVVFGFGQAGDQPVSGDWDGDGRDSVGVYRAGMVYLRNSLTTGVADGRYPFGGPGDTLVSGDWNGDGFDTTGVWRSGVFHLTNSNLRPTTDVRLPYGDVGDLPAVGDWDGNGTDTPGVFRAGTFLLRNSLTPGPAQVSVPFGDAGDRPVPGVWQARTATAVGVSRRY